MQRSRCHRDHLQTRAYYAPRPHSPHSWLSDLPSVPSKSMAFLTLVPSGGCGMPSIPFSPPSSFSFPSLFTFTHYLLREALSDFPSWTPRQPRACLPCHPHHGVLCVCAHFTHQASSSPVTQTNHSFFTRVPLVPSTVPGPSPGLQMSSDENVSE